MITFGTLSNALTQKIFMFRQIQQRKTTNLLIFFCSTVEITQMLFVHQKNNKRLFMIREHFYKSQ